MLREILEGLKKPKNFYIHRPRPNSKKWDYISKKPESGYLVSIDEENYCIKFDTEWVISVIGSSDQGYLEWDHNWDWGQFSKGAGQKIKKMIEYIRKI